MKKFYFALIFLGFSLFISAQVTTPTGNSAEVGITEGQLSVSLSGGANYAIPIAVPPGINGVVPQVSLTYNSQGGNGMAGYGWNISGISAITRIPRTKFHDDFVGGVNLDANDRFAFDGQRLIVKNSGVYGADNTEYETENFSNVKIKAVGVHPSGANYGPASFLVEYPDGSKAEYGVTNDSRSIAIWSITYWQNPQGVRISYSYNNTNNNLTITSIKYGAVTTATPINEIQFVYKTRQRPEQSYVGGQSFLMDSILSEIKSIGNGVGFRNYVLAHNATSLGYERLTSISEKSGDNTKSYNPTVFSYDTTGDTISNPNVSTTISLGNINASNASTVSGDFDGDGKMDFLVYPTTGSEARAKYWLFNDITSGINTNIGSSYSIGRFDDIFPSSWLSWDNKLMPMQGWTTIKYDNSSSTANFSTYSYSDVQPTLKQYEKEYQFPKFLYSDFYYCEETGSMEGEVFSEINVSKRYVNGDFNGDGLTDVIAIENPVVYNFQYGCDQYTQVNPGGNSYFINLDRRVTDNTVYSSGIISSNGNSKFIVADFNGDGKSDIYVFDDGFVKVYTLANNGNYYYFNLLYQNTTSDPNILTNKPILMGDYNGDGKNDFCIPQAVGQDNWCFYLANGSTSGFNKIQKAIGTTYFTNSSQETYINGDWHHRETDIIEYNYLANDLNGDGKTDIIRLYNKTLDHIDNYTTSYGRQVYDGTDYTNRGNPIYSTVRLFNNLYTVADGLKFSFEESTMSGIHTYPIPLITNHTQPNLNLQFSLLTDNTIYSFNGVKNNRIDTRLTAITTGNGVKESITYKPLNPQSTEDYNQIYTDSGYTENYPYTDLIIAPTFQVVSKLEKQSASVYKKQLFSYYGAVSNVEGLGFLGFRGTMRTNWHDDNTTVISSVAKNDINFRGANIENYTVLWYGSPQYTPTDFISKSVLTYQSDLSANKVFKLQNTNIKQYNGLDNTNSETTTTYDAYNNPTQSTTELKNGTTVEQTTVSTIDYDDQPNGSPYVIGRPLSKNTSITVPGDATTTEELYTYTNNLLTKVKKKGHNTNYITEDNVYDSFGNITQKTITATGLTPRVTSYEYDTSGRFLTKSTDIEGLATTFDYNGSSGVLNSETNPYALTTSYLYDPWFKKIKTTDYLGKNNIYAYSRSSEKTIVSATGDDGSYSEELFDDLGRKITAKVKDINGNFSSVDYVYDIYDRNYKTSEPYFGTSPSQWNETQYDVYGRPVQNIAHTGKTTTVSYSGLTTTVNDGTKTKESIKNATGNVVSMTDTPGGTITYTYFANGNLKTSDYGEVVTTIEQDGWGRKTKLTDPSAGVYEYTYNDLGETTSESTPKGITTYTLDSVGKLTTKDIVEKPSLLTNSSTTYTYDGTTKLLTSSTFTNTLEGGAVTTNSYEYDTTSKRLFKTIETTPYATFTKEITLFDDLGRVKTEKSTATTGGSTSIKTIKNNYQNGYLYQILDDATSQVLWQTNTVNERGQLTGATLGNGIDITNTYDSYGFASQIKHDRTGTNPANIMTLNTVFDPLKGNLTSRTNSMFGTTDNFYYDNLDRLTSYPNAQGILETQVYDDRGRITQNNLGTYNYNIAAKPYQNTSVTLTPEATGYYVNREGIFSDSMESQQDWVIYDPTVYTYDTTEKHSGNTSLKIANTATTEKVIHSQKWISIDNATDTYYTYSAWVYTDNPEAELFLFMKTPTETGYFTYVNSVTTNIQNQWVKLEGTFLVPANIKKLNLRLDNNSTGNVWFDDVQIRKTSNPVATDRQLNITYNTFKSPVEIEETGVDKISFTYNDDNDRSAMFYGSLNTDKLLRPNRKYYSADGTMEVKQNIVTGAIEFITYIGGDGYSAPIVVKSDGTTQNYLYLHRDYQGSILAITDANGTVLEKRLFDAWGAIVQVQDGAGNTLAGLTVLDRGYTGHEHLQSVGLIHMNGRLYDPKLHRFLQPDNYVQDPSNTQNYNRYGYVLNNPLKYTDPSGEFFFVAIIIGAIVGAYIGGSKANDNWNPVKWDWSSGKTWAGIGTGALIGAVAGEVAWAGITGQMAFGIFNVSLGAGVAVPGLGTFGIYKSGEYFGTQFTNTNGQTFNQNIGTVPIVKPKTVEDVKKDKGDDSFHPGQYLPNFKSDVGFDILKFKGLHYGVPEFETSLLNGRGAITPGPISFYPTRGSYDPNYSTHEPGHALQFALMGTYYYPLIALPSIINTKLDWRILDYTEKTANELWYWWSGEKDSRNKRYRD